MKKIGTSIPDKTYINNFVVKMEITKKDGEKEHTDWLVSHCLDSTPESTTPVYFRFSSIFSRRFRNRSSTGASSSKAYTQIG
jgi:hypothetical protein